MQQIRILAYKLIKLFDSKSDSQFQLLRRVFKEQYKVIEDQEIKLRPKEKITSDSLQSPYDQDEVYRQKGEQKVKEYKYSNRPDPDSIICDKTQKQQRRQVVYSNQKKQKIFLSKSNKSITV